MMSLTINLQMGMIILANGDVRTAIKFNFILMECECPHSLKIIPISEEIPISEDN